MTDNEQLLRYRIDQATETIEECIRMVDDEYSPRTIVNRSYYAVFYSLLALFIHDNKNVKTSKHSGVISAFDREYVKPGIFTPDYSKTVHRLFDIRQEYDYVEFIEYSFNDAKNLAEAAGSFVTAIKEYIS